MIYVNNLEKSFGKNNVLKGVNEHIKKGEVVVVIGPSGSGKSTFLRCLNLLEEPTGGEIIFEGKNITDKLSRKFSNARIESIDENFFVGASSIPTNYLVSTNLQISRLNFQGITSVGDNVFASYQNLICTNTLDIKTIGSNSFNATVSFEIGTNVKVQQNSFGEAVPNQGGNKIIRKQIFDSSSIGLNYNQIYNQKTKILDFTKIELLNPYDATKLIPYQNIYQFLFDQDVEKIILPKLYILPNNLFNNLHTVQEIVFQRENQIILQNTFQNTTIINKPVQNSTSILLDLDNFFN